MEQKITQKPQAERKKTDITIRLTDKSFEALAHLNPEQKEAVMHINGPILVIAGAGTGKTRVITERIAYLINNGLCKNNEVLALTFTEKAAFEMEERLDVLMPIGYEAIAVSTFHAFCEKILRQYGIDIGISPNFRILEGVRLWQFIKEHLFEFDLDYYRPTGNPTKFIDALISHFSRLKEELNAPEDYLSYAERLTKNPMGAPIGDEMEAKRMKELANAYNRYQELLAEESYLDFADLQSKMIELLEKRPNILKHLQSKYKYILVDEYQDTNIAQNRICDMLAAKHKNLMAVGDDDQSIYKFRGAAISNILQFEEKYPDLKKVVLNKNYRSSQKILDFAYTSISKNNPDRLEVRSGINKKLTGIKQGDESSVIVAHCTTIEQEVEYVIDEIRKSEVALSEIAILFRANMHAYPFIEAFRKNNIPYQFLSERGLYDKPEVKELISVLRVVANPKDDISFYHVLRLPFFNVKMETIVKLIHDAKSKYSSIWSQLKNESECMFMANTITDLLAFSKNHTIGETLYRFIDTVKLYEHYLKQGTVESEENITNIATFFSKIREFERESEYKTVIDFVAYLDLAEESGENPSAKFDVSGMEGVQISTVHGVKGLEFHTVFVGSLVNRRFPSDERKDPIEMPDELTHEILTDADVHTQEERRLFYVACTRAKEKLHLMYSDYYNPSSATAPRVNKMSKFLGEIIDEVSVMRVEKTVEGVERFLKPVTSVSVSRDGHPDLQHNRMTSFSYSQITTFQSCPRQYQYQYIYKIPQPPAGALSFGISLHNTLLSFYRLVEQNKQASLFTEFTEDLSLKKLLLIYDENWLPNGYESKAHMESAKKRGGEILELFYGHFKEGLPQIEFLEKAFKLKVGDYTISGRIDRADRLSDGTLEIIDYKTGKARTQEQVDKDLQLQIYALASQECLKMPASKMTLYFLDDDARVSTEPNPKKMDKLKQEITEVADEINKSDFAPAPDRYTCMYCPYKKICDRAA